MDPRFDIFRDVLANHEARLVENMWVDVQTASAILTVYAALNDKNKSRFEGLSLIKMADVSWKLLNKGAI